MGKLLKHPVVIVGGLGALLAILLMSKGGGAGGGSASTVVLQSEAIAANSDAVAMKYNAQVAAAAMAQAHADFATNTGFNVALLNSLNAENNARAVVAIHESDNQAGIVQQRLRSENAFALATLDARTRLALAPIIASNNISLATIKAQSNEQIFGIQSANQLAIAQVQSASRNGASDQTGVDLQNAASAAAIAAMFL